MTKTSLYKSTKPLCQDEDFIWHVSAEDEAEVIQGFDLEYSQQDSWKQQEDRVQVFW